LISKSEFALIAERLKDIVESDERIPPDDRDRFLAALEDEDARRDLAIAINGLLHGKRMMEERFKHCLSVFRRLDLDTWPLISVWLAALHPGRYFVIDSDFASEAGLSLDWPGFCQSQRAAARQ